MNFNKKLMQACRENPTKARKLFYAARHEDCEREEIRDIMLKLQKDYPYAYPPSSRVEKIVATSLGIAAVPCCVLIPEVMPHISTGLIPYVGVALALEIFEPKLFERKKKEAIERYYDITAKAQLNVRLEKPYVPRQSKLEAI